MDNLLKLFKMDIGIVSDTKDMFFTKLLESCKAELEAKGLDLDIEIIEDCMLVSDYAAWTYRKRQENIPLSMNLQLRIRNRMVKRRVKNAK